MCIRIWPRVRAGIVFLTALSGGDLALACDEARFVADGEGVVIDTQALLMWRSCPEGLSGRECQQGSLLGFSWRQGVEQVARVNAAQSNGYDDWAIPTLSQLQSLADTTHCGKEKASASLLSAWPGGYFWSRNSEKGRSYIKRTFSFESNQAALSNEGTFGVHLWLVRKVE